MNRIVVPCLPSQTLLMEVASVPPVASRFRLDRKRGRREEGERKERGRRERERKERGREEGERERKKRKERERKVGRVGRREG
ncbi:hypothetical protein FHG87_005065 [Trinorchestia longiramus]|nr:hypothetical protein FHG87_005065 [Trinorchestia longiramus]